MSAGCLALRPGTPKRCEPANGWLRSHEEIASRKLTTTWHKQVGPLTSADTYIVHTTEKKEYSPIGIIKWVFGFRGY